MSNNTNVAIFIDADNISAKKFASIFEKIGQYGTIKVRKIYGNWQNDPLKSWESVILKYALEPVQQFDYTKGKNATDIAMTIDVMENLFTHRNLDTFCIISSDSDFTPLVSYIKRKEKTVIVFGESKTPQSLRDASSEFILIDGQLNDLPSEAHVQTLQNHKQDHKQLIQKISQILAEHQNQDGWIDVSCVAQKIKPKDYGYSKITTLIKALDFFKIKTEGSTYFIQDPSFVAKKVETNIHQKMPTDQIKQDIKLLNIIRTAINDYQDQDGDVSLSQVGNMLKLEGIDCKQYGYKSLSKLLEQIDLFEVRYLDNVFYIRHRAQPKANLVPLSSSQLQKDKKLITMLYEAVEACMSDEGANIGTVNKYLQDNYDFDVKKYGYSQFSEFLKAIDIFDIEVL